MARSSPKVSADEKNSGRRTYFFLTSSDTLVLLNDTSIPMFQLSNTLMKLLSLFLTLYYTFSFELDGDIKSNSVPDKDGHPPDWESLYNGNFKLYAFIPEQIDGITSSDDEVFTYLGSDYEYIRDWHHTNQRAIPNSSFSLSLSLSLLLSPPSQPQQKDTQKKHEQTKL